MFDLDNGKIILDSVNVWLDLGLSILFSVLAIGFLFKLLKRGAVRVSVIGSLVLLFVAWFFNLRLFWGISLVSSITLLVIALVINQGVVRDQMANSLGNVKSRTSTEKVFDRHALLVKVDSAVQNLSKNKIGAIITFEKDTKLDDFIKSGTVLNAPVTPELLMTIFYPGTRLHDGAVVIRRDLILAASVYYTPTTKPLTGKFGSRHRASIGISEVSDSVTVVVSEETGRISLAVAGELIHVPADRFLRTLEDYILAETKAE